MNSVNSLLLSVITKNERYGQDVDSLHKRYQSLSLIYVNVLLTVLLVLFNVTIELSFNNPCFYLMNFATFGFSILSFICLRLRAPKIATIALLLEMHSTNFICTYNMNLPLVGIYAQLMYPFFIFMISSAMHVHLLNTALCAHAYYLNTRRFLEIFEVTLVDEQFRQVCSLIPTGIFCCFITMGVLTLQKVAEAEIWQLAQENYAKSEFLTKEVVQAMEAKDTFVSMLSHEIRNPLNSLKGSIDYLLQVIKNHEYIQVLKNAKMSGDILLNLVSNVLDAAKLKSDKMEIVCMETDLVDTIKKVYAINSEKFKEKKLLAKAFIDESVPKLLWIDPSRLLQILMNLLSNSVKFTPENGRISMYVSWCPSNEKKEHLLAPFKNIGPDGEPEQKNHHRSLDLQGQTQSTTLKRGSSDAFDEFNAEEEAKHYLNLQSLQRSMHQSLNDLSTLSACCCESTWSLRKTSILHEQGGSLESIFLNEIPKEDNKGFIKLQITDTGCGIAESYLPTIFDMFAQTTQGARPIHGGTGLGLWICKQLCQKMNGDIAVYSGSGKGCSFVLYFPVDNNKLSGSIVQGTEFVREKIRALVVDDYSVNRYLHKLLLEQDDVEVATASNGIEAVEKYKAQMDDPFDFILMDVQMPEMDGFTATRVIRQWEKKNKLKKVDVYFVTGEYFNDNEVLNLFKQKGGGNEGIRCLRKPIASEMLNKIALKYKTQPQ